MIRDIEIRRYEERDIPEMINIWNEVVKEGVAFHRRICLRKKKVRFFSQDKVIVEWQ